MCEIPLQSWMEPVAAIAGGSAAQDHMHFSGLQAAFTGYCLPNPRLCMNHQMCKPAVWQSPLSTSLPMVVFWAKEYGQLAPQDIQSPESLFALIKQSGRRPRRSVWGS